jgi:hypothetical protein
MRRFAVVAIPLLALVAWGSAFAGPISLGSGPIYLQYSSAEQFSGSNSIPVPGGGTEGNWGIAQISIIQQGTALTPIGSDIQGGGNTLFFNGQNGGNQILGMWYGVQNTSTASGERSTGGILDLYWFNNSSQNVGVEVNSAANLAKRTAFDEYTGFTCASGNTANCTFLVQLDFTGGADPSNYSYTISTPVDPSTLNGTSKSYLNVDTGVVGAWTNALNQNFFTLDANNNPIGTTDGFGNTFTGADVRLDNNFTHNAGNWSVAGTDIVGLRDNDPARASVPEPGTLALLGAALLAFGFLRVRSRRGV